MTHQLSQPERLDGIERREKVNFFKTLSQNWYLVVAITMVIIGWANLQYRTEANAEATTALTERVNANEQSSQTDRIQLSSQLSQIQTDLQWIKGKLK